MFTPTPTEVKFIILCGRDDNFWVRSYSPVNGAVRWSNDRTEQMTFATREQAEAVAAGVGRVREVVVPAAR